MDAKGKKTFCPTCRTKFYDFGKEDGLCPKCCSRPSIVSVVKPQHQNGKIVRLPNSQRPSKEEIIDDFIIRKRPSSARIGSLRESIIGVVQNSPSVWVALNSNVICKGFADQKIQMSDIHHCIENGYISLSKTLPHKQDGATIFTTKIPEVTTATPIEKGIENGISESISFDYHSSTDLSRRIESWVKEFPGMSDGAIVTEKFQPLYSSIATTALNGPSIFLMGINPGMDSDYSRGLDDWNQHLPFYRDGIFKKNSIYHSYLDYHPRGRIVRGFENILSEIVKTHCAIQSYNNQDWLRSIPTGNLFVRATHNTSILENSDQEKSSLVLLDFIRPNLIVLMGSDHTRLSWLSAQKIISNHHEHPLPFPDARGRRIIIRSAQTHWGGRLVAVPHPNALSGNQLQRQVGAWLNTNWFQM